MMLLNELLKKVQFHHNQTQLEELDDHTLDDDVSTQQVGVGLEVRVEVGLQWEWGWRYGGVGGWGGSG